MGGPLQHAMDIAELDELARIHDGDVVAEPPNDAEIVADEQKADALVAPEARQQAQDLCLDRDVERSRRLVEDQERRFTGERSGDQRALPAAADASAASGLPIANCASACNAPKG